MLVVSYGGSLIFGKDGVNDSVKKFLDFLQDKSALVVTGGGTVARDYIKGAKKLGVSDPEVLDLIAIGVTRMNAELLRAALSLKRDGVSTKIPHDPESLQRELESSEVVFMGGTVPGQTTDMVALRACTTIGEKTLYNLTKVDGIFTANPHEDESAELIAQATCSEIEDAWGGARHKPGLNYPIEPQALSFARENGIEMFVLSGDTDNFKALLEGKDWLGTHLLAE